jgi:hypothetical protein
MIRKPQRLQGTVRLVWCLMANRACSRLKAGNWLILPEQLAQDCFGPLPRLHDVPQFDQLRSALSNPFTHGSIILSF